jgi:hypothetical protein
VSQFSSQNHFAGEYWQTDSAYIGSRANRAVKGILKLRRPCIPAPGDAKSQGWRLCGTTWVTRILTRPIKVYGKSAGCLAKLRPD